jgi:hypothetical protein
VSRITERGQGDSSVAVEQGCGRQYIKRRGQDVLIDESIVD